MTVDWWGKVIHSGREIGWRHFHHPRPGPCSRQTCFPARAVWPCRGQQSQCLQRRQNSPHPASPGSRSTGSARRIDASQTMTSCGQQPLNVLAVLSLLISAGRNSAMLGRRREGEVVPSWCQCSAGLPGADGRACPSGTRLVRGSCLVLFGENLLCAVPHVPASGSSAGRFLRTPWG